MKKYYKKVKFAALLVLISTLGMSAFARELTSEETAKMVELLTKADPQGTSLETLNIEKSEITSINLSRLRKEQQQVLASIGKHFPNLETLNLSENSLTDADFGFLESEGAFAKLREIDVSENPDLLNVDSFLKLPSLKTLHVSNCRMAEGVLACGHKIYTLPEMIQATQGFEVHNEWSEGRQAVELAIKMIGTQIYEEKPFKSEEFKKTEEFRLLSTVEETDPYSPFAKLLVGFLHYLDGTAQEKFDFSTDLNEVGIKKARFYNRIYFKINGAHVFMSDQFKKRLVINEVGEVILRLIGPFVFGGV